MDTYTPVRAMIICANGTGDYIKKEDAIKVLQNILGEKFLQNNRSLFKGIQLTKIIEKL